MIQIVVTESLLVSTVLVAVPPGVAHGQELSAFHRVDRRRVGVQDDRPRRGGQEVGHPQEQAQDELREALEGTEVSF